MVGKQEVIRFLLVCPSLGKNLVNRRRHFPQADFLAGFAGSFLRRDAMLAICRADPLTGIFGTPNIALQGFAL
jgi:hypothetical protein